jgi:ubiquinone/menaquinone biosynthesis C-methylase UbiE
MTLQETDKVFTGSIPKLYQEHLVPMIFESYAVDLAQRLASSLSAKPNANVLELAAGTGAVTRHLAALLPATTSITATDLNPAMLAIALHIGTPRDVTWEQADALKLPFADGTFDAVVCQFGVMFFPDKSKAFSEARRVLKPGGVLLFNVWDKLDENEFPDTVNKALAALYPNNPSHFMARAPHGYYDQAVIARDLKIAGFSAPPQFTTRTARSHAVSARVPAVAFCQGTPVRAEIEARDPAGLSQATDAAEKALIQRFGAGAIDGKIQGFVVSVES